MYPVVYPRSALRFTKSFSPTAQEILYPPGSAQGVHPTAEDMLWPGGSDVLHSDPFGRCLLRLAQFITNVRSLFAN